MVRMKRRGLAALLALCVALGLLAGCGGKDNDAQQLSATVYVPQYVDLGIKLDDVSGGCADGEYIYIVGETNERIERRVPDTDETYYEYTYSYDLYRVPLTGGTAEKLPNYTAPTVPEGYDGSAYINSISAVGDGTLWVMEVVDVWGRANETPDYSYDRDFAAEPRGASTSAVAVPDIAIDVDAPVDDYEDEDFSEMNTSIRRHISADGTELESIEITSIPEKLEEDYIRDVTFGEEGNIYVAAETTLYVLDSQLNTQFTLELPEDSYAPVTPLGSGKACINYWYYDESAETSSYRLKMIDFENQDWGVEYALPSSAYSIYPGGGDYIFYYELNGAIFGWRADAPEGTETGERLFSWLEADINSDNVQSFYFLPDGRVAALTREWKDTGEESILEVGAVIMTATPRDQLPEKTTLTYATMYLNYSDRSRIIDFNKTSKTHRIVVKDYSEYNTASDSNAGLQKLNTEIVAGMVPDILCTDGIPLKQYAAKGVLEDLWPFIDNDPELGRDKLMVKPLEADQMGGKLYEVFASFTIQTVIGAKSVVGDRMSWTLQDLQDALAKMPEGCSIFGEGDTKTGMLDSILNMNLENFVDWDTGKCYFDTDTFKSLLAFCNTFASEFNYENVDWDTWEESDTRIITGKQMLIQGYLGSLDWSLQRYNALFPDGLSYIGFPMEDGSVGSSFSSSTGCAISTTCKDKDSAWSFVRQVLLPQDEEGGYYSGFSINKADFDAAMEKAMTPEYILDENGEPELDENGEPMVVDQGGFWIDENTMIEFHLPTQEEVDQFMDLYNSITAMYRYDQNIYDIVSDAVGSYFAGDRNLDDTASQIQNRVNLYVNELK